MVLLVASTAHGDPLDWPSDRPKVRPAEVVATVGFGALNVYLELGVPLPERATWTTGILFDDAARGIRLHDASARDRAEVLADVTLWAPQLTPVLLDPLPAALNGKWETVLQMELIDAEAYAVTGLLTRGLVRLVPRQRPVVQDCEVDPSVSSRCNAGPNASFPSGHTGFAFTGAALTCFHHTVLPLYGGGAPDVTACVVALGLATTTGVTRLLDDRHWASDVVIGAAIGAASGLGIPALLHGRTPRVKVAAVPIATPEQLGLAAVGAF